MSESFPFFNVAKLTNKPLSVIYKHLNEMEYEDSLGLWAYKKIETYPYIGQPYSDQDIRILTARAALAENARRVRVYFRE